MRPQGGSPTAQRALRSRLADAVRAAPTAPESWWALLAAEEATLGGATATLDRAGRGGVSLFDLYRGATQAVPRQGNYQNDAFIRIWLGFARQQWCVGVCCALREQDAAAIAGICCAEGAHAKFAPCLHGAFTLATFHCLLYTPEPQVAQCR